MTDRQQARCFALGAVAFYLLMLGLFWDAPRPPAPAGSPTGPVIIVPSLGVLEEVVFVSRCARRLLGPPAWVFEQLAAATRAWAGAGGC